MFEICVHDDWRMKAVEETEWIDAVVQYCMRLSCCRQKPSVMVWNISEGTVVGVWERLCGS